MEQDKMDEAQLKSWLFKENMRLEELRAEIARASQLLRRETLSLQEEKSKFEQEKEEVKLQMHEWTGNIRLERKKLEEDQGFFDKKFKILEMGFKQLDADRKAFESKKRAFEYRKREFEDAFETADVEETSGECFFFKGVTHPLALKKRYKDLIKIYHPDNLSGDKTMLQQINKEYECLKKTISYQKKA